GLYIVVLFSATIVTIIGLSALTAARIEFRQSQTSQETAIARSLAQSAIEAAAVAIGNDASWRTNMSHNTWTPETPLGIGTISWKLVDEVNGSLTADTTAPVRIYGRGAVGQTVRMYSVLVDFPKNEPIALVSNPDFDSGISGWTGESGVTVSHETSNPYSGTGALLVSNRWVSNYGARTDITSSIDNNTTYEIRAWVRMKSSSDLIRVLIVMYQSGFTPYVVATSQTVDGNWTPITVQLTPSWTGSLLYAELEFSTQSTTNDFCVDAIECYVVPTVPEMYIVPGSWRREVAP
ncbi:MAG: hypothetical protein D6744_13065, partial [Planctomycetota bacterium]